MQRSTTRWAVIFALTACAPRGSSPPVPPGEAVIPRHPDQVCADAPSGAPAIRFSELFDTVGLVSMLDEARTRLAPSRPPWPRYEFIVRYDGLGAPAATGTWEAVVGPAVAAELERQLSDRVLAEPGLLGPVGFRVRISFPPRPTWGLAPPVACLPHLVHTDGQRPVGLPEGVTTWAGPMPVRDGDLTGAVLRIHVDRTGQVTRVENLRGVPATLDRARDVVRRLRFDPALTNGAAVDGVLVQSFRFTAPQGPR